MTDPDFGGGATAVSDTAPDGFAPGDAVALDNTELPDDLALRLADPVDLASALEAILFVVEAPVSVASLAASLQLTTAAITEALDALRTGYNERSAGFELREIAGGVRLFTRPQHAEIVEHFLHDGQRTRLTQAALETLAVIAYRQPVTRQRVSAIRGVNVDGVVRTLLARGLVVEVGQDPDTGGGLFRTTDVFLEKMGLRSLDELPSLAPLLPDIDGLDDIDDVAGGSGNG
ncbi:SMC-Scp complex subunit ScpB [uncultured Jatrophihabitans sp.]|uniref:SMC-Scp complex subunit ScpB n=1 Tax=uncultured Jatrophihabitans sp. TaxID=1610747 RepID=UPI0035CB96E4